MSNPTAISMQTISDKEAADMSLIIATARCLDEQLANLQGVHSQDLKLKFGNLNRVSRQYTDAAVRELDEEGKEAAECLYDTLMDVMYQVKDAVFKNQTA